MPTKSPISSHNEKSHLFRATALKIPQAVGSLSRSQEDGSCCDSRPQELAEDRHFRIFFVPFKYHAIL